MMRWARSLTPAERVAYGSTCVYALVFTAFAIARHLAFQSQRVDLGNMTQAIWTTTHGHFLEVTTDTGREVVRLGIHTDVFLVLLVPLWWIWSSPLLLVTLQAIAVSAGALPVFWLARKHLGSQRSAAFFAFAYLLYPATQFNAFAPATGFHAITIAIPLLLLAIWFLDEDRLVAFAIVALLAASTKEEIPLAAGMLGIWYGASRGRWRVGLSIFAAGLALTLINFLVVIPHFNHGAYFFGDRYAAFGHTPGGIVRTALTDPGAVVHAIATTHKLVYLLLVFGPFLGLCLLEPLLLLGALPDLVINLLSSLPGQTSVIYNDTSGIVPFVVAGTILGLARLNRQVPRLSLYVLAAVAATAVYSPLIGGSRHLVDALPSNPVHKAKVHALSLIPPGAPVSASNQLGAHLSERRRLLMFPVVREAQWIVVDRADPSYFEGPYGRRIERFRHDPAWSLIYSSHGVLVFHAAGAHTATASG
jgi:uncharacterized membrane protein